MWCAVCLVMNISSVSGSYKIMAIKVGTSLPAFMPCCPLALSAFMPCWPTCLVSLYAFLALLPWQPALFVLAPGTLVLLKSIFCEQIYPEYSNSLRYRWFVHLVLAGYLATFKRGSFAKYIDWLPVEICG